MVARDGWKSASHGSKMLQPGVLSVCLVPTRHCTFEKRVPATQEELDAAVQARAALEQQLRVAREAVERSSKECQAASDAARVAEEDRGRVEAALAAAQVWIFWKGGGEGGQSGLGQYTLQGVRGGTAGFLVPTRGFGGEGPNPTEARMHVGVAREVGEEIERTALSSNMNFSQGTLYFF